MYSFNLPRSMTVQMDSCDSSYDTYLRIFDEQLGQEYSGCDDCGACGLQTVLDAELEAGSYILVIEGFSSNEGEYAVTMNCPGEGDGGITVAVSGSSVLVSSVDDAEELTGSGGDRPATNAITTDASELELCFDGGAEQIVGVRFRDVGINQGATVDEAFIDFAVGTHGGRSRGS